MIDRLTLLRPDDWHIHLRDGALLARTVADASRTFARAIIMPNLVPPVRNAAEAQQYRQRILDARPDQSSFQPLMVLYLTDQTSAADIHNAANSGFVHAAKLYPAGATTNSDSGVTALEAIYPALEAMSDVGMPLLVHGEVTHADVDIFDREKRFIDDQLVGLVNRFPHLKWCLNTSPPLMPRSLSARHPTRLPPLSLLTICSITAITCWPVVFARIFIAYPFSSVILTKKPYWMQQRAVLLSFS